MCLISATKEPTRANHQIEVLKVVRKQRFGLLYCPVMNELLRETPSKLSQLRPVESVTGDYWVIGGGVIHAYIGARSMIDLFGTDPIVGDNYTRVIRGTITIGTPMYTDRDHQDHVAATRIIWHVSWYQKLAMKIRDWLKL